MSTTQDTEPQTTGPAHTEDDSTTTRRRRAVERIGDDRTAIIAGVAAHAAVGLILRDGVPVHQAARTRAVFLAAEACTRAAVAAHPRHRAIVMSAASSVASYINRFRPLDPWTFVGHEVRLSGGVADLVFADGEHVVIDEIKTGVGRTDDTRYLTQARRYAVAGIEAWGPAFLGVRLVYVAAPLQSKLISPGAKRAIRLADTPLWQLGAR